MPNHRKFRLTSFVFTLLAFASFAQAPADKEQLFGAQRAAVAKAKTEQVDLLAPRAFEKASRLLQDAETDFDKGRKAERIQKNLAESRQALAEAETFAAAGRKELNSVIKTREETLSANAPQLAAEAWKKADERFRQAVDRIERDDAEGARRKGAEAEVLLRDAELIAIKASILTEARNLIAEADEKEVAEYAPRTLEAAKGYLTLADQQLTRSRYDTAEPKRLAAQASYEARHASYLAIQVARLQNKDTQKQHGLEQELLALEEPIRKLAAEFDIDTRFDQGYAPPMQQLLEKAQQLQKQLNTTQQDLNDRNEQIVLLNAEIEKLQSRLGGESEERLALQKRLTVQERQRENISRVESLFTVKEGRVYRQGNNIVMSLTGISFRSGKSTIEPSSFPLLGKVNEALKLFPNASISVEGHTDAAGSDSANLLLSQDRADAVRQYLVSNLGVNPENISSVGYGEARPVASNENEEGRARNRRIDLVLHVEAM